MRPWEPPRKLEKEHGELLRAHMRKLGWGVWKIHGSLYMKGWPDYYCHHPRFGERWVEMKRPEDGVLHKSQIEQFRKMQAHGVKITIAETVADYPPVLQKKENWWQYMPGLGKEWRT